METGSGMTRRSSEWMAPEHTVVQSSILAIRLDCCLERHANGMHGQREIRAHSRANSLARRAPCWRGGKNGKRHLPATGGACTGMEESAGRLARVTLAGCAGACRNTVIPGLRRRLLVGRRLRQGGNTGDHHFPSIGFHCIGSCWVSIHGRAPVLIIRTAPRRCRSRQMQRQAHEYLEFRSRVMEPRTDARRDIAPGQEPADRHLRAGDHRQRMDIAERRAAGVEVLSM